MAVDTEAILESAREGARAAVAHLAPLLADCVSGSEDDVSGPRFHVVEKGPGFVEVGILETSGKVHSR